MEAAFHRRVTLSSCRRTSASGSSCHERLNPRPPLRGTHGKQKLCRAANEPAQRDRSGCVYPIAEIAARQSIHVSSTKDAQAVMLPRTTRVPRPRDHQLEILFSGAADSSARIEINRFNRRDVRPRERQPTCPTEKSTPLSASALLRHGERLRSPNRSDTLPTCVEHCPSIILSPGRYIAPSAKPISATRRAARYSMHSNIICGKFNAFSKFFATFRQFFLRVVH